MPAASTPPEPVSTASPAPARTNSPFLLAAVLLLALVGGTIALLVRAFSVPAPGVPTTSDTAAAATAAFERAEKVFREQDDARAAELCKQAIAEFPQDQRIRLTYAKVLTALKQAPEAYAQMEAALAIGPTADADLQSLAGALASAAGKPDRAVEHYTEAQRLQPTNARHPLYLAMCQIKLGQDTQATASLLHAIKIDSSLAEAWGSLAELSLKAGNPSAAIPQARKARELQPTSVRWRLREAIALKRDNQPEAALQLLTALPPADRNDEQVLKTIAESFAILGKPADAAAEYARAAAAVEATPSKAPDAKSPAAEFHYQAALFYERANQPEKRLEQLKLAAALGHAAAIASVSAEPTK